MVINNKQAPNWFRNQPKVLSDFVGRPEVYRLVKEFGKNKVILDLGCGEGYVSRKAAKLAKMVIGIDRSKAMIKLARQAVLDTTNNIHYLVADAQNLSLITQRSIDLCLAVHLTQYIKPHKLVTFYQQIKRVLKKDGFFIILMPHPVWALTNNHGKAWHYQKNGYDYIKSQGKFFKGGLKSLDEKTLKIGVYHTTLSKHFNSIFINNLTITRFEELVFPKKLAKKHKVFNKLGGKVVSILLVGRNSC